MATFPSYAKILVAGYGEEADFGVLRTDTDAGIAKQRPRYSKPIVARNCILYVEGLSNKRAFDAWLADDLNGATAWFDYMDCVADKQVIARIVGGKVSWGEPKGRIWTATCQIESVGR